MSHTYNSEIASNHYLDALPPNFTDITLPVPVAADRQSIYIDAVLSKFPVAGKGQLSISGSGEDFVDMLTMTMTFAGEETPIQFENGGRTYRQLTGEKGLTEPVDELRLIRDGVRSAWRLSNGHGTVANPAAMEHALEILGGYLEPAVTVASRRSESPAVPVRQLSLGERAAAEWAQYEADIAAAKAHR